MRTPAFPYRLAAIDLDDTLLGPDKEISPANAAAVAALRTRGVAIVLASGRRHENLLRFCRQLGLDGPVISCNGAQVKVAATGALWHERRVPAELAAEVLADGAARGITQNFYHADGAVYVAETTPWSALYEARTRSPVTPAGDLSERFSDEAPLKILWVDDGERVLTLLPAVRARYAERLGIVVTDPEYLEFLPPGVHKGDALAVAAQRLGIPRSATLAFGDGSNDVEMLAWAGCGVAMAHGRESARAAADRIAPEGDPAEAFARAVAALLEERTPPLSSGSGSG